MTVYHTSAAEGCTHVHDMCTALLSSAQNKNEKEALAMPELTSRFRDFFVNTFPSLFGVCGPVFTYYLAYVG